ncbi:hypothetical protein STENM223S_04915 [Streptomyces tendae]
MSGRAAFTLLATGVRSVAAGGASTSLTVVPPVPSTAFTAAALAWPKALSWASTTTFLPREPPRMFFAVSTSW